MLKPVPVVYNSETKELDVTFKNNAVYRYFDISKEVYEKFKAAPSHGKAIKEILGSATYKRIG